MILVLISLYLQGFSMWNAWLSLRMLFEHFVRNAENVVLFLQSMSLQINILFGYTDISGTKCMP
jgi:hypothetical protein